jgi:hypothetical protein
MFTCEFCNKEFTMKGNMISHQKTTKYCLEKQGKNLSEDFKCEYCDKIFTLKTNLNEHVSICRCKKIKEKEDNKNKDRDDEIKKIRDDYQQKINERDQEIKKIKDIYEKKINDREEQMKKIKDEYKKDIEKYQTEINYLNKNIEKLETKLESYEKKIFEMASRPNTTNTNNNNHKTVVINNTNLPLTNDVLRQCAATLTLDNARNIEGITKHFTSSLEDHITCTDQSRRIFKYTNDKDEEIIDTELENIIPQYLIALKDENNFLYKEVFDYFKTNNVSLSEQTDYNIFYNALNAIIERKGQQNKYSEKMKKYIVRQCKKQFLEKNKNKEKEITKELTDEDIMMNIIKSGGGLYDFLDRLFDMEDIDNETDEQFEYRRKMEDLFKQRKKEWNILVSHESKSCDLT